MVKNASDRWAVLIGINGYHESLGRLKYSVNDCRRLAEVLTTGDDAFPADHVLVLTDDEAAERKPTYANIHSWLASWLAQPAEDDTVLVFFAGHGREMDGKCYLVPGDATLQTIHVTGIPVPYVQELLSRCKARQKVLVLDACHSGAGRDVSTMAAPMIETLSAGKGIYTLTSCDVDELSHEWDEKKQGVFSYCLAEALSGSCPPDGRGRVTAEAVYEWTFGEVRCWCAQHRCSQNPQRFSQGMGALTLRTDAFGRSAEDNGVRQVVRPNASARTVASPTTESRPAPSWPLYVGIEGLTDSKGGEVSGHGRDGVMMGDCVVCHRPVKGAFFDLGDRASDLDGQDVSGGYSHYCIKCQGVAHKGCVKESFFFGPDKCRVCGSKLIIVAASRDDTPQVTRPPGTPTCDQKHDSARCGPQSPAKKRASFAFLRSRRALVSLAIGGGVLLALVCVVIAYGRYGWQGYLAASGIASAVAGLALTVAMVWSSRSDIVARVDERMTAVKSTGPAREQEDGLWYFNELMGYGVLCILIGGGGMFGVLAMVGWLFGVFGK